MVGRRTGGRCRNIPTLVRNYICDACSTAASGACSSFICIIAGNTLEQWARIQITQNYPKLFVYKYHIIIFISLSRKWEFSFFKHIYIHRRDLMDKLPVHPSISDLKLVKLVFQNVICVGWVDICPSIQ